jgi:hypothetical protein
MFQWFSLVSCFIKNFHPDTPHGSAKKPNSIMMKCISRLNAEELETFLFSIALCQAKQEGTVTLQP